MTEQQEKIQNLLDDFILKNDAEIQRVSTENPLLLKSVLDVVEIISKKYGSGKAPEIKLEEPVEEKSEEVVDKDADIELKEGDKFYKADEYHPADELYEIVAIRENDTLVIKKPDGDKDLFSEKAVKRYFKEGVWVLVDQNTEKPKTKWVKKIMPLYKIDALSTPDKLVLTNEDGSKTYEYLNDVLFDTDPMTGKRTDPYPMNRIVVKILPSKETAAPLFKVGDFFYHKSDKSLHYKILDAQGDSVNILTQPNNKVVKFPLQDVNQYFTDGTWVNIGDPYLKRSFTTQKPQETKVETVSEIKQEPEAEQLSAEDIKVAIKNLKPLAEFDDDVKKEIEALKQKLKGLKTKKS